jgi:hypothetical protein
MFGGFTIPEAIKDKVYMIVGLTTFPFIRRTPKEVYEEGIKNGLFIKREVQQRTPFAIRYNHFHLFFLIYCLPRLRNVSVLFNELSGRNLSFCLSCWTKKSL